MRYITLNNELQQGFLIENILIKKEIHKKDFF